MTAIGVHDVRMGESASSRDPWLRPREQSRRLRRDMNFHERLLWSRLRSGRACGLHFRRQHRIGSFFVDFACLSHRLVVEVDGESHTHHDRDRTRDALLAKAGWHVIRITNQDVLRDLDGVVAGIAAVAETRSPRDGRRKD